MELNRFRFIGHLLLVAGGIPIAIAMLPALQAQTPDSNLTQKTNEESVERKVTILDKKIAKVVAKLIQDYHYDRVKLDDTISSKIYDEYFLQLDPNRYFFTAPDLEEFSSKRYILDDLLSLGNVDFAFKVYDRFLQRISERVEYVKENVENTYDFTSDDYIILDRTDGPWAKDREELDEIWRKRLKNQLLVFEYLMEEDDEKDQYQQASQTSAEKVVKRYENYLKFFSENDTADVMEYYITTLLSIFDPHSSYLNWRSVEDFDITMRLSLQGIGATLKSVDGYTEVVNLVPGGPADKDGRLQPGDRIVAVGQADAPPVDVVDMPLNKVVRKIRGPKGAEVRLTVVKSLHGAPSVIEIIRDKVKLTDQEAKGQVEKIESANGEAVNLGVIHLPSFYADFEALKAGRKNAKRTSTDVKRIIDDMIRDHAIDGLIIDLRSNGGGSLEEAIALTGLFIPEGPVVQVRSRDSVKIRKDTDGGFFYDLPLVVLVNRSSASASEIFSGAIKDYGRGVIVGDKTTHGKGTVQTVLKLNRLNMFRKAKPGAMKYTMAKFYRVTGASTQQKGVTPDIIYPSFLDHIEIGEAYLKHIMPWDEIKPAATVTSVGVSSLIPPIVQRSEKRLENNTEFQRLKKDIERYGVRKQEKKLSLNKDDRIALKAEDEYWSKRSQAILGNAKDTEKSESNEEDADSEESDKELTVDLYLTETLEILSDLVSLTKQHDLAHGANPKVLEKN